MTDESLAFHSNMIRRHLFSLLGLTFFVGASQAVACGANPKPTSYVFTPRMRANSTHSWLDSADHTCRLFEKIWGSPTSVTGCRWRRKMEAENTLIYILRHKSREAAKESFAAFGKDPEWIAARNASEAGGKILAKATPNPSFWQRPITHLPCK